MAAGSEIAPNWPFRGRSPRVKRPWEEGWRGGKWLVQFENSLNRLEYHKGQRPGEP